MCRAEQSRAEHITSYLGVAVNVMVVKFQTGGVFTPYEVQRDRDQNLEILACVGSQIQQ